MGESLSGTDIFWVILGRDELEREWDKILVCKCTTLWKDREMCCLKPIIFFVSDVVIVETVAWQLALLISGFAVAYRTIWQNTCAEVNRKKAPFPVLNPRFSVCLSDTRALLRLHSHSHLLCPSDSPDLVSSPVNTPPPPLRFESSWLLSFVNNNLGTGVSRKEKEELILDESYPPHLWYELSERCILAGSSSQSVTPPCVSFRGWRQFFPNTPSFLLPHPRRRSHRGNIEEQRRKSRRRPPSSSKSPPPKSRNSTKVKNKSTNLLLKRRKY